MTAASVLGLWVLVGFAVLVGAGFLYFPNDRWWWVPDSRDLMWNVPLLFLLVVAWPLVLVAWEQDRRTWRRRP